MIERITKYLIWVCLGVILFSPLYLNSHLFFPYIVTKTIAFNIAVEVMLIAWLFLAYRDSNYKLKINLAIVLMAIYIVIIFISSLLGDDFYRSFWSNNERSEGILLLLHLFVFLFVLTNFFRKFKDWLYIFDLAFIASLLVSLYALGQFFHIAWLPASSGGVRLAGTIGNAGYMAGYLIFGIFFGLVLLFNRHNIYLKTYYLIIIILETFIVYNTQTRGGILALLFTGLIFIFYILFYYLADKKNSIFNTKNLKFIGYGLIVVVLLLSVFLFKNKDSDFVKNSSVLSRLTSISFKESTAQTRFMAWSSAFAGFKERPILGWGYENFYQPFDKHFNPLMYEDVGSVVWFDRAHNIIFDRLLTGGILGLVSYLSLLFLPLYYLWRHYFKKEDKHKYFIPVIFTFIVLAYFIQNMFIFEALVTYIPLFLSLAFISLFTPHYNFKFLNNDKFKLSLFVVVLVLFLPIMYIVNIKPVQANSALVKVLSDPNIKLDQRIDLFKSLLSKNTNGNPEYRQQLFNFLTSLATSKSVDQEILSDLIKFSETEFHKQIIDHPESVTGYLLLMRFNSFLFNGTGNPNYLKQNFDVMDKVVQLAPSRQHVYYEIGYSYYNLASYFKNSGNEENFKINFDLAVKQFEKAISLNEKTAEPYKQLAIVYSMGGEKEKAIAMAKKAADLYRAEIAWSEDFINKLKDSTP